MIEVAKPDERSIMTYVAAFYHAFAGDQKVLFFSLFTFLSKKDYLQSMQSFEDCIYNFPLSLSIVCPLDVYLNCRPRLRQTAS